MDRHTKTNPLEDFLKQCESHATHNKTKTYNGHFDNSPNENITRNMQQKVCNTKMGIYSSEETQKILILGQLIEKEGIMVTITQELNMEE